MNKFILILGIAFLFSCGNKAKKKTTAHSLIEKTENQEHSTVFEYEAFSRGFFLHIEINEKYIKMSKDRSLKKINSKKCLKKDWEHLLEITKVIAVKRIGELKAPDSKRHTDAAAIAHFKIILQGHEYHAANFDHGNPPEEIKQLVNTILSLAESIE